MGTSRTGNSVFSNLPSQKAGRSAGDGERGSLRPRADADEPQEAQTTFSKEVLADPGAIGAEVKSEIAADRTVPEPALSPADIPFSAKSENWLSRKGHTITFVGIFLFTLVLYFRPYELIPALAGFQSIALIIAIATLLVFVPVQMSLEGTPTALPTEVKCVLFLTVWALISIPLAKSPGLAWATFNDTFIKVVLIFIVMVNTLRTPLRVKSLIWLGIAVGIMLSIQAVDLYMKGEFRTEGYRVSVDFGGMFGNPNDMSIHLVIFIPLAIALGAGASRIAAKAVFFAAAGIMTAGSLVTQSRGAFLGLIAVASVLVWKLGRGNRLKAVLIAGAIGLTIILLAPGNYGLRILSIFVPSLDPVGSSNQRSELLIRSLWVTLRNPLGIGIGNFEIVGSHNLGTHNAYTQVSSELGWLAFAAYLALVSNPIRRLNRIENELFGGGDRSWLYYLAIGVQASIAGYLVSSFFSSVAYHWYVYYPVAYAIGLRRIYQLGETERANAGSYRPVPAAA